MPYIPTDIVYGVAIFLTGIYIVRARRGIVLNMSQYWFNREFLKEDKARQLAEKQLMICGMIFVGFGILAIVGILPIVP